MTVDTTELRTRARNLAEMDLPGTAGALTAAADEIDTLRTALAEVPHSTVCAYMTSLHGEPCSCAKSAITTTPPASPLVSNETSVTYLGVTRLNVFGPGGLVNGVLGVTGVHVDLVENGRALQVVFEQGEATT